jgi:hypothetical protein
VDGLEYKDLWPEENAVLTGKLGEEGVLLITNGLL